MYKLVIFDLDGTLLNTLEDLTDSVNYAMTTFNYPIKTLNQVRSYIGNGVPKLIERAIPAGIKNPNYNNCLKLFKDYYTQNMTNKTLPYSGIIPLLKELKRNKIITVIASNKFDLAVKELSDYYFGELIDFAIGENEENGIRKKPSPDSINVILKHFNIDKSNALYVGDSEVDIQTAKNSNLKCISVCWGYKNKEFLLENGADTILDKPENLFEILFR